MVDTIVLESGWGTKLVGVSVGEIVASSSNLYNILPEVPNTGHLRTSIFYKLTIL